LHLFDRIGSGLLMTAANCALKHKCYPGPSFKLNAEADFVPDLVFGLTIWICNSYFSNFAENNCQCRLPGRYIVVVKKTFHYKTFFSTKEMLFFFNH
jgi:hypothetical protein